MNTQNEQIFIPKCSSISLPIKELTNWCKHTTCQTNDITCVNDIFNVISNLNILHELTINFNSDQLQAQWITNIHTYS